MNKKSRTIHGNFLGLFFLFFVLLSSTEIAHSQSVLSAEAKIFAHEWNKYENAGVNAGVNQNFKSSDYLTELEQRYGLIKFGTEYKSNASSEWMLPVWLGVKSEEFMDEVISSAEKHGFVVQTKLKTVCTGLIPASSLKTLAEIKGVNQIQTVRKVESKSDLTRTLTHVKEVQSDLFIDPQGNRHSFKGEGVIVGVVDGGFDYLHPNFYDSEDTSLYRVKRVWDQNNKIGTPPQGYDYGAEYTTKEDILKARTSSTEDYHGTHVAGIAAGSGGGTDFVGMAPKADLVFVATNMADASILDGVYYLSKYAEEVGMPCAVNLSLGGHVGPHDGSSLFDIAIEELKRPGFVVVGSAGNSGSSPIHIKHSFAPNSIDTLFHTVINFDKDRDIVYSDIWGADDKDFMIQLSVFGPSGLLAQSEWASSDLDEEVNGTLDVTGGSFEIYIYPEHNAQNNKKRILTTIQKSKNLSLDTLSIVCSLGSLDTDVATSINMWGTLCTFSDKGMGTSINPIKGGDTEYTVGEIAGVGKGVISVGAYVSRNKWKALNGTDTDVSHRLTDGDLAYFSSKGPTADGRAKPDITAPGSMIMSSFNSFAPNPSDENVHTKVERNGRSYYFGAAQGTSMSSPAVAGIVALCLEARNDWQVDSIKKYFATTSINDQYTGDLNGIKSNEWGLGKINTFELLKAALPGYKVSKEQLATFLTGVQLRAYPNPCKGWLNLQIDKTSSKPMNVSIYDIQGRIVKKEVWPSGQDIIRIDGLNKGFYVLFVNDGTTQCPIKICVN